MAESDIEGLNTDVGTLKTDVSSVKTALNSKQDTIVGAASTIVENNLTAGKVLVSDASGKVGADASISNTSDVITMNKRLIAQYNILCTNNEKIVELDTDTFSYPAVRFGQNASTKAIKIFGEVEDKVVEFSTESEDFVTLRGVADATEKSDAVNLSQLNSSLGNYVSKVGTNGQTIASSFEAANSIKAQTGGEVNNTIELLSSDVAPSLVATSGGKGMSVSFVPQYSEVSFNTDDNVTLTGIKAGTNDTDAVNVSQLNTKLNISGGTMTGNLIVSNASYPKVIVQATSGAGDGVLETSGNMTQLVARSVAGNSNDYRGLLIRDANNQSNINKALQFANRVGGASTIYIVLHSGNVTEYAAPPIQYSTTDLTAGSSSLATGSLYVVYE